MRRVSVAWIPAERLWKGGVISTPEKCIRRLCSSVNIIECTCTSGWCSYYSIACAILLYNLQLSRFAYTSIATNTLNNALHYSGATATSLGDRNF